jgi:two-component sensor histidine kinase
MTVFRSLANAKSGPIVLAALALITVLMIAAAYRSAIDDIDSSQRESARDYAARTRVWITGAARTLVAAAQSAEYAGPDKTQCDALLREASAADPGYPGIRIDFGDGRLCARAKNSDLTGLLEGVSRDLQSKPRIDVAANLALAAGNVRSGAENFLAIQVDAPATADIKGTATAVIDARALSLAIGLSDSEGAAVALMSYGQEITAEGTASSSVSSWLPADAATAADEVKVGSDYQVATARSRTGATFNYVIQPVLGAELYLLIQSDNAARTAVQWRFFALALAALLLAALGVVLARAIQADFLRWIDAIKAAMLARNVEKEPALAPEDGAMPVKLRELAAAYNEMARESAVRETSLHTSLVENAFLLRELNHRVKSSLQIIQSYMSLTRRLDLESGHQTSACEIEARVQVLSIAYRKAFSEGRMRDVRIRQFAEEIIGNLSLLFEHPGVELELKADVVAAVMIDEAIPLGLALVECVMAALEAEGARVVAVRLAELEELQVEMRISTDGALGDSAPNAKLMAGLALQLGARVETPDPGSVILWRFRGRPPPILKPLRDA